MDLSDDRAMGEFAPADPRLEQATGAICSLDEAWSHALDVCVIDSPLSEVILPLMRCCFFVGALHAVFLLHKGYGDQLASDIASFIMDEPRS